MSANVEQAAKELLRLQAELEALEARIKEQKAILIDAVEVGGTVEIDDPPKPTWREMVDEATKDVTRPNSPEMQEPLACALYEMHLIAAYQNAGPESYLARIVAIAEAQVGDGWQADPERVHPGFWGVAWLLVPLSHEPPDWAVVGNRAAAWLRELCK